MSRWKVRSSSLTLTIVTGLVVASGSLGLTTTGSASAAPATTPVIATTTINVHGDGGDKTYQGTGAILGGGGNARYLMDYPASSATRSSITSSNPGTGPRCRS